MLHTISDVIRAYILRSKIEDGTVVVEKENIIENMNNAHEDVVRNCIMKTENLQPQKAPGDL